MRVTRTVFNIYHVLKGGGWIPAVSIAKTLGKPRQNIKYALSQLEDTGVIERSNTSPIQYRIRRDYPVIIVNEIEDAGDIYPLPSDAIA